MLTYLVSVLLSVLGIASLIMLTYSIVQYELEKPGPLHRSLWVCSNCPTRVLLPGDGSVDPPDGWELTPLRYGVLCPECAGEYKAT